MALKFRLKRSGVRELLLSAGVAKDLQARADRVADKAKTIAPTGPPTLHYKQEIDSWVVKHKDRVVARAGSHVNYATSVEAKHRVLGRSIDAARD